MGCAASPGAKCSVLHCTAIVRLPTPMKPPKSMTAACGSPSQPTRTSTSRPTSLPSGPATLCPRIANASSGGTCCTLLVGGGGFAGVVGLADAAGAAGVGLSDAAGSDGVGLAGAAGAAGVGLADAAGSDGVGLADAGGGG